MNSTPTENAALAAEHSQQPRRVRVTDYDRLVDDLAYTYEGIFSRDSIAKAVADAPRRSNRRPQSPISCRYWFPDSPGNSSPLPPKVMGV